MSNATICFDFDGTLAQYKTPDVQGAIVDKPVPGMQGACYQLAKMGFGLVVYSARCQTSEGVQAIAQWLKDWEFPRRMLVKSTKPYAAVYVDDRAYRFDGDAAKLLAAILTNPTLPTWQEGALVWDAPFVADSIESEVAAIRDFAATEGGAFAREVFARLDAVVRRYGGGR